MVYKYIIDNPTFILFDEISTLLVNRNSYSIKNKYTNSQ